MTSEPPPYPGEPGPSSDLPSYRSIPPPQGGYPPETPLPLTAPSSALEGNTKSLWSMILGILSLFWCGGVLLGPAAIVLSNLADKEIAATGGAQTGKIRSRVGLILGMIGAVGWLVYLLISTGSSTRAQ